MFPPLIVLDDSASETSPPLVPFSVLPPPTPCYDVVDSPEQTAPNAQTLRLPPPPPAAIERVTAVERPSVEKSAEADEGFAMLEGRVGDRHFRCIIKTLLCVVGRETGFEPAAEHNKQFCGYHCKEITRTDFVCVNIFRPSGLSPFETNPWHPFDLTRIGFGSFKKLSRTHFSISWNSPFNSWVIICLSGNGVTLNDKVKLKEGEEARLVAGDSIGAANNTVRLTFHPAI